MDPSPSAVKDFSSPTSHQRCVRTIVSGMWPLANFRPVLETLSATVYKSLVPGPLTAGSSGTPPLQ